MRPARCSGALARGSGIAGHRYHTRPVDGNRRSIQRRGVECLRPLEERGRFRSPGPQGAPSKAPEGPPLPEPLTTEGEEAD